MLILHEMKKENGSIEAMKTDKKLKDYQNSRVVNYVRLFRRFADKNTGNSPLPPLDNN